MLKVISCSVFFEKKLMLKVISCSVFFEKKLMLKVISCSVFFEKKLMLQDRAADTLSVPIFLLQSQHKGFPLQSLPQYSHLKSESHSEFLPLKINAIGIFQNEHISFFHP